MTGSSELILISKWKGLGRANVVFVHGLGGHPYDTWRRASGDLHEDESFWPRWLAEDVEGLSIYSLGYSASPSGWLGQTMAIEDRALELKQLLCRELAPSTLPLIFICHSLGGIIVKRILLNLDEDREGKGNTAAKLLASVRRIVFLATPHRGAGHASFMDVLRRFFWPTSLTIALSSNATGLRQINNSYKLLAERRKDDLDHTVLHESWRTPFGKIVPEGSADPGLQNALSIGTDADHFGIAKPTDRKHRIYTEVLGAVQETVDRAEKIRDAVAPVRGRTERQKLQPYDNGSSLDYFGLVLRMVLLSSIMGALYFFWPSPPPPRPDDAKALYALSKIKDKNVRGQIAELLLGPLSPEKKAVIEGIVVESSVEGVSSEVSDAEETALIEKIEVSSTREDLLANIAKIRVASCRATEEFEIKGDYLVCADGTPVPIILSKASSAPLSEHKALVFHFTASASPAGVLKILTGESSLGNFKPSAHLFISREGEVIQLVPFDRQAIHAGKANRYSIGISLSNAGLLSRTPDGRFLAGSYTIPDDEVFIAKDTTRGKYWQSYTTEQIRASEAIVRAFRHMYPDIVIEGHSDVDNRHLDPGPAFPLSQLRAMNQDERRPNE